MLAVEYVLLVAVAAVAAAAASPAIDTSHFIYGDEPSK